MSSEAPRVYRAMRSVDYNVVVDVFMTPTAVACADIVLPCGHELRAQLRCACGGWPLRSIVKVARLLRVPSPTSRSSLNWASA